MNSLKRSLRIRRTAGEHPVDEMLPVTQLLALGTRHMLAAYAGIIAPPFIIGTALHLPTTDLIFLISASLLASGLTTLLQTLGIWKIGVRLPLVQGVSFSGIASMIAIGKSHTAPADAMRVIVGAVIVASAVMFFVGPLYSKLLRFFPPLVMGAVVTVIGISLIPISIGWLQGTQGGPQFGSATNVFVGIVTLLLTLFITKYVPGFTRRIGMLVAMALGTLVSVPFGLVDFGKLHSARIFAVPTPFHFGAPHYDAAAIISMTIVMLVIMTETTADMLAIAQIVERPVTPADIADGLRADCLGSMISGGLNGFQSSAYGRFRHRVGSDHCHRAEPPAQRAETRSATRYTRTRPGLRPPGLATHRHISRRGNRTHEVRDIRPRLDRAPRHARHRARNP
jgi:uracil-xanthine permease